MNELQIEYDFEIWDDIANKLCTQYVTSRDDLTDILMDAFPDYNRSNPAFFLNMDNKWFWQEIPKIINRTKPHLHELHQMALLRKADDGLQGKYARYFTKSRSTRNQDCTSFVDNYYKQQEE